MVEDQKHCYAHSVHGHLFKTVSLHTTSVDHPRAIHLLDHRCNEGWSPAATAFSTNISSHCSSCFATETAQQSPVLDKNHHEAFRLQPRMVPVTTTNIAPSVIHCSTVGRTILISGNSCLLSSRESGRGARLKFVLRETCKHITAPVPPRRAIHDNFEWHAVEEALL